MKKTIRIMLGSVLLLSLVLGACNASSKQESKSFDTTKKESKSAAKTELGGTYWSAAFDQSPFTDARKLEIFFFTDGTFHAREFTQSSYIHSSYYSHFEVDEYLWRLDGDQLELEFKSLDPNRRIIYNAKYADDEIIVNDFIEGTEAKVRLTKQDTVPRLSNMQEDSPKLKGEWIEVYQEEDGEFMMVEDHFTPSTLQVMEDGKNMVATYTFNRETATGTALSDESFVDAAVQLKNEPAYDSSLNEFWHAELTDATNASRSSIPTLRTLTLIDDDTLILGEEWDHSYYNGEDMQVETPYTSNDNMDVKETDATQSEQIEETTAQSEEIESTKDGEMEDEYYEDDEYDFYDATRYVKRTFLRKDSDAYKNREEMRYHKTVTVSNVQELKEALSNNTRILLKEGTYNLSDLSHEDSYSDSLALNGMNNIALEAESGKKVELVIEDDSTPVISIYYSKSIKLKGLTIGHDVPGNCSGSVIYSTDSDYLTVEDCHLYGCGTYGIEAETSNNVVVKNTEIYECTYGLLYLSGCYNVAIKNSVLRDSKDISMVEAVGTQHLLVENSKFKNNQSNYLSTHQMDAPDVFIQAKDGEQIIFRNCDFSNNIYQILSEGDVTFENCTFDDQVN